MARGACTRWEATISPRRFYNFISPLRPDPDFIISPALFGTSFLSHPLLHFSSSHLLPPVFPPTFSWFSPCPPPFPRFPASSFFSFACHAFCYLIEPLLRFFVSSSACPFQPGVALSSFSPSSGSLPLPVVSSAPIVAVSLIPFSPG